MFQRLKGAIDSRIAEEQARQRASATTSTPLPAARSTSRARQSSSRNDSPSAKPRRPRPKDDGQSQPARGRDPAEFEAAFVIEDESEDPSRVGTPVVGEKSATMAESANVPAEGAASREKESEKLELPFEVQTKLRKLEKMETRYQELLKSYRIAHKRVGQIEPFEKTLKEHTPLTTISDPDALAEYLNQLHLKGDMVMDEFKRVSADREEYKKKFEEAEKRATIAQEELAKIKVPSTELAEQATEKAETASVNTPSPSIKSPVSSVLGGIFSPKQKPVVADNTDVTEEFFSYDDEIPQLQMELKEKTAAIEELNSKISGLERDLATAQESSSGLVENLERITRELGESREAFTETQAQQAKFQAQTVEVGNLKEKLEATEARIAALEKDLIHQKKLGDEQFSLVSQLKAEKSQLEESLNKEREQYTNKIAAIEASKALEQEHRETIDELSNTLQQKLALLHEKEMEEESGNNVPEVPAAAPIPETQAANTGAAKKKTKKKKKGGNAAASTAPKDEGPSATPPTETPVDQPASSKISKQDLQMEIDKIREQLAERATKDLRLEISSLKSEIADRDVQIEKLQTKRKTEDDLREEIENMQENFLQIAQEHVEAKEKIKELQAEKKSLQDKITNLEQELEASNKQTSNSEKAEADLKVLAAEVEDLRLKSSTLQTDLGAAEKLASDRYRDFKNLRGILDKAQPEMVALRAENAALKLAKEELATRTSELRRLETREKDLKSDVAAFKKQAADRDNEVKTLNDKVTQETNGRLKAEDQCRIASRDLRRVEADKIQLSASGEKSAAELMRVQEEAGLLRIKVDELEAQVTKLTTESRALRDEVELRGSQYTASQNLVGSMRDQAGEMAMQLKEAKSQSESLEEEMVEVQRLLNERTREGETMRRLLADVDDRADAKVREMRERMEAAIEERDRAEDEASTNGRRRAREVDELKTKIRDYERDLKRAVDDRDELSRLEKEWKRKRDELESSSETASKEVSDIRIAMGELRSALDGSEKQVRDGEKQRADLRRILDEANQKYEKIQKEFKALQAKQNRLDVTSSRNSFDSGRGVTPTNGTGAGGQSTDLVYLKTILLQFIQLKDKRVQGDLIKTVLGQLLQFSKQDQEKWIAVISSK